MKVPDIQQQYTQDIAARSSQIHNKADFAKYMPAEQSEHASASSGTQAGTRGEAEGAQQSVFSTEEREYFARLFPAAAGEVSKYQTYSPTGPQPTMSSGSLIDRKG